MKYPDAISPHCILNTNTNTNTLPPRNPRGRPKTNKKTPSLAEHPRTSTSRRSSHRNRNLQFVSGSTNAQLIQLANKRLEELSENAKAFEMISECTVHSSEYMCHPTVDIQEGTDFQAFMPPFRGSIHFQSHKYKSSLQRLKTLQINVSTKDALEYENNMRTFCEMFGQRTEEQMGLIDMEYEDFRGVVSFGQFLEERREEYQSRFGEVNRRKLTRSQRNR